MDVWFKIDASNCLRKHHNSKSQSKESSMMSFDHDWPRLTFEDPECHSKQWVLYYLVLHVHINITHGNADVHKHTSRQTAGGKFRLTWPQLWRHRSRVMWVMGFEIFRQDAKMRDEKVYKVQCHSPVKHESYFRKKTYEEGLHYSLYRRGLSFLHWLMMGRPRNYLTWDDRYTNILFTFCRYALMT